MATAARQSKGPRKGPPEPNAPRNLNNRAVPAWGSGARASPTFSPTNAPVNRQQQPAQPNTATPTPHTNFPPLAQNQNQVQSPVQANGNRTDNNSAAPRDRVLQSLSGLTGTTVTLVTKTNQRLEGVVSSTAGEGDTSGVTLKDVRDVNIQGAPLKDSLFIASTNIESYTSGPADAKPTNGDSFRTDTDISQRKGNGGRERDLQAWMPSGGDGSIGGLGDDDIFGPSGNGSTSWDQFQVNEQLFGVKASFDEDIYTTKLDRSAPDFKERERRAQRIANEIIGAATNNPHIAEERGIVVDDSGANEEDKYGAVVRGQNAYVPPGARRQGPLSPGQALPSQATVAPEQASPAAGTDAIPKVSVNGPDGAAVAPVLGASPSSSKSPSPAPPASKPAPADAAFRDFVANEKNRLTQKRQALVKLEMDKRVADLVKFSKSFKLKQPIPEDLVPILTKDEEKQRLIKEKAKTDAEAKEARAIGPSNPTQASRGVVAGAAKMADRKPVAIALAGKGGAGAAAAATNGVYAKQAATNAPATPATSSKTPTPSSGAASSTGSKKISMVIPAIPPFKGGQQAKAAPTVAPPAAAAAAPPATNGPAKIPIPPLAAIPPFKHNNSNNRASPPGNGAPPMSPNSAANRLNVNASSFRPNPKANAFTPVSPSPKNAHLSAAGSNGPNGPSPSHTSSPKPPRETNAAPHPFFGTRVIKKSAPVNVKDEFNPFKHGKVMDAAQVAPMWPYTGKRYMQMFPVQHPPQPHGPHMPPPAPTPMIPPPPYEDDAAMQANGQQAQPRAYIYAYPPYGYPPHVGHMMPGMGPPGPPGAYMQGPYMAHMPYPPGMPPPNAMYSPGMQMPPPPQGYMQPPPPGTYPPPPNGAGPRQSMPPTPIPAHAHAYYHQSPQSMAFLDPQTSKVFTVLTVQHAYPMMMPPPPPNMPPHSYEGGPAPPVQMGGHA
ncbi:hypothetical protein D9619_004496 [Psilocybe cf. subviscida]|uniref:LsmAD domain-containing protein n=1 Tax=Psilocybe cf. subviscida TaxID=2480587 RepID=A0A8H5BPA7_9AGAR|nr:hypothetical protein D9619_004496 [Psilocybe cf. subviscida]